MNHRPIFITDARGRPPGRPGVGEGAWLLAFPVRVIDTQTMTKDAAVVAIVISLMGGYYWARWRRAEATNRVAKQQADAAGRGAWRARGAILLVGVAVYLVIDLWIRGRGR